MGDGVTENLNIIQIAYNKCPESKMVFSKITAKRENMAGYEYTSATNCFKR